MRFTWTETPQTEMWRQLRYLQSPANVANVLTGQITSARSTHRVRDASLDEDAYIIATCVRQADQYFAASEQVGLATRPLLQFYGAESLAKAAIVANTPAGGLRGLNYHGLSTRLTQSVKPGVAAALRPYVDDASTWRLPLEFAVVNEGVFPKLCAAVGVEAPRSGTVLSLRELLRVLPDLAELVTRHVGERAHCLSLYTTKVTEGRAEIFFNGPREHALSVFPEFATAFDEVEEHGRPGFRAREPGPAPEFLARQDGTVGGRYVVRPLHGVSHALPLLFASMFIVSNVVRYKPAFWMRELEGVVSGDATLVEALCNLAQRRFPNEILAAVWNERFEYGTPARLG